MSSEKNPPFNDSNLVDHPVPQKKCLSNCVRNVPLKCNNTDKKYSGDSEKQLEPDGESLKKTEKNKKGRCAHGECKKKISLMGFDCKCRHRFCIGHLPSEVHICTFDYQSEHKKKLRKNNAVIGPIKVTKI